MVRLDAARVVCAGAGSVAAAKALPLLDQGADLEMIAPAACPSIAEAAELGRLRWHRRAWRAGDADGALLILAATDHGTVNAQVVADAAARATLCVRVDRDGQGSADVLATLRRGPLTLAVSTAGRAPALASYLRAELGERYGPEWGELVTLIAELRQDPAVRQAMDALAPEQRRRRWRALPVTDILPLLRGKRWQAAQEVARACLSSSSD